MIAAFAGTARIIRQDLPEVVVTLKRPRRSRISQLQQRTVLRGGCSSKRVGGSGNIWAAELPEAAVFVSATRREDGIEVCTDRGIDTISACGAVARRGCCELDAR